MQAESNRIRGVVTRDATSIANAQDQFYWLGRINMASTVMLVEERIIPAQLAKPIAEGVQYSIVQAREPGGKRPTDVMQVERIIFDKAGADATLVHTGRSRQDMGAAVRAMRAAPRGAGRCRRADGYARAPDRHRQQAHREPYPPTPTACRRGVTAIT